MKVSAVIAEYNIFHNGHKYMLDKISENSDAVIDGTLIRLEVTSDNRSKPYDKLTPLEQFNSDFVFEFLHP